MLKDRLILKRRKACCISLITLPPLFFFLATLTFILMDSDTRKGELMTQGNFYYSTNQYQSLFGALNFPANYLAGSKNMPKNASNFDGFIDPKDI